ncbi:MAK10-like protein [Tanacetum coccineum]
MYNLGVITHLAPMQPNQVNKITSSCEICSGPHDTQYYMKNLELAFVEYASSHTDEAGGLVSNFMASQDARLSKFEADFKQKQSKMTNKIDTILKAITYRIAGALSSDTVKNLKLNVNSTSPVSLGDFKPFDTLADLGACVNIILLYLFKKLNIGLLEETNHVFGLADGTKSYLIGIVRDVEVHIGRLKLLTDFYVINMKKDPETPLLVGRVFLATVNAVINCRKPKIAVEEGITRSMFEESEDLIKSSINWDKPPKNGDGAWHAKIRLIDLDGEELTRTLQSVPTSRKLFEREDPREIIILNHFYDRKFFKENKKKIFSEAGDGVRIYPDSVVIFDEKKIGSS